MLDAIIKLAESVTPDQTLVIQKTLGDSYGSFHNLMLSKTNKEAKERFVDFRAKVKKLPMLTLLALHGELTDDQRKILEDLL